MPTFPEITSFDSRTKDVVEPEFPLMCPGETGVLTQVCSATIGNLILFAVTIDVNSNLLLLKHTQNGLNNLK